ncbi:MAG: serine--tRNA ligase, partial [Candidatus Puniceispirillum sp.]|nr:serine--tRNA ligase [Candidatus Puniceispirillum sp.]
MHDIGFIRDHPEQFTAAMQRRSVSVTADEILDIDRKRRALQSAVQDMQSRRNAASKDIGARKAKGEDADDLIAEVNRIKAE